MKRLAIVGAVLLLAAPANALWGKDKRQICAEWAAAGMIEPDAKTARALGIKNPQRGSIQLYCEYYKS